MKGVGGSLGSRQSRQEADLERRLAALERAIRSLPSRWSGGAAPSRYVAIDDIRVNRDISPVAGVTIKGIEYDPANPITSVPTLNPASTAESALTGANLGRGRLRAESGSGALVWVATAVEVDVGGTPTTITDITSDIPYRSSVLSVESVELQADDQDPGVTATVYLVKRL